ncbi:MAG: FkbM family methyltransferase [Planctomycetota bacterium]
MRHPLCRDHKLLALRRVVSWQIASRMMGVPLVLPFTKETRLVVERGNTGATGNYYCGLHEFEDMAFVLNLLRPEDLFVDIGANIGSYTILASGESRARTIAVEPLPETFHRLRTNVRANDLDELVTLKNLGIGDSETTLRFTKSFDTVNHVATDADEGTEQTEVPVIPLDLLLADEEPICIKIDVEGFEQQVVDGGPGTLQGQGLQAVLLELNGSGKRYGYDDQAIHDAMIEFGFTPFLYDPFQRELTGLEGRNTGAGNTLYLRDIEFVQQRLDSAPEIALAWRTLGPPKS